MDLTQLMGTMLSNESVDSISQRTGADRSAVTSVLASVLPQLLSGANTQAQDENTGFAQALAQHQTADTSSLSSFIANADQQDGLGILGHLLGGNTQQTASAVSTQTGVSQNQTSSIMSLAAPLMMSLLGQQTNASQQSASGITSLMGALLGSGDSGSIISSILGAVSTDTSAQAPAAQSGGDSIISSILGAVSTDTSSQTTTTNNKKKKKKKEAEPTGLLGLLKKLWG